MHGIPIAIALPIYAPIYVDASRDSWRNDGDPERVSCLTRERTVGEYGRTAGSRQPEGLVHRNGWQPNGALNTIILKRANSMPSKGGTRMHLGPGLKLQEI